MSPRHYSMIGTIALCVAVTLHCVESFTVRQEVTGWLSKDKPVQAFFAEQVPDTRTFKCKTWLAWSFTTVGVVLVLQGRAAAKGK